MSVCSCELMGLVLVLFLIIAGFIVVYIFWQNELSLVTFIYGGIFLLLCFGVYMFICFVLLDVDFYFFLFVVLFVVFGFVIIYWIDQDFVCQQVGWFVVGIVLFIMIVLLLCDVWVLECYWYVIAVCGIGLLVLLWLSGIGVQVNGVYFGVDFGLVVFQLTELAKICIVVFFASYLIEWGEVFVIGVCCVLGMTLLLFKYFGLLLVVWGVAMLMFIVIRDLGSLLMFFGVFLVLLYLVMGRLFFVFAGMALFVVGVWFFVGMVEHVGDRVDIWFDFWQDVGGSGYQIVQLLFAQVDGGLFGRGFGESLLDDLDGNMIVPVFYMDLIYVVITNEVGLFGAVVVVLIYLLFAQWGFKIAAFADDGFEKLLVAGFTVVFVLQVFVIVGGVMCVIPLMGVIFLFVSYGGSSIVANFILLGLFLMILQWVCAVCGIFLILVVFLI